MRDDMHVHVLAIMMGRKRICPAGELVVESILDRGEE